ncbi:peptidylprolyl isomerase [Vallitalea guaymasensis]|uniref:peptidylprolyl isomerase n=1 Tax=Vallitalea guaymasensis TaxID=1185412 RepID=A0A8J8M7N4_9FIRM|nr:hypothetical protein [Vallitalea guaymasensis]QUH27718.1 hypothetical protein HYG85_01815 [Vallitalea guaymasensis]
MKKKKRSINVKKFTIIITIILTFLVLYIVVVANDKVDDDGDRTVAYVNDEPVSLREFKQCFSTQQDLDYMIRIKIEQLLFREKNVVEDISYKTFIKSFIEENERRKKALDKGEIIYGPKEFQEDDYYSYLHSKRVLLLKEILAADKFALNDEKLKVYYDNSKKLYSDFKKQDYIEAKLIKISPLDIRDKKLTASNIKELIDIHDNIFDNQIDFQDTIEKNGYRIDVIDRVFDETTARNDIKFEYSIYNPVSRLEVNEISEIIDYNGAFYIIKCISRKEGSYYSFEDKKDIIRTRYNDEKYEELIQKLMNESEVKIVDEGLDVK